jgi:hypothetical protein
MLSMLRRRVFKCRAQMAKDAQGEIACLRHLRATFFSRVVNNFSPVREPHAFGVGISRIYRHWRNWCRRFIGFSRFFPLAPALLK